MQVSVVEKNYVPFKKEMSVKASTNIAWIPHRRIPSILNSTKRKQCGSVHLTFYFFILFIFFFIFESKIKISLHALSNWEDPLSSHTLLKWINWCWINHLKIPATN
jgi:hypothetical protein